MIQRGDHKQRASKDKPIAADHKHDAHTILVRKQGASANHLGMYKSEWADQVHSKCTYTQDNKQELLTITGRIDGMDHSVRGLQKYVTFW